MSADFGSINLNDLMNGNYTKKYPVSETRIIPIIPLAHNNVLDEKIKELTDFQGIGPINSKIIQNKGYSVEQIINNPELLYDCGIDEHTVDGIISMNAVLKNKYIFVTF